MEQPEAEREETLAERLDRELNEFIDAKTKEAEEKRKQPGYVSEKDKDIETILKVVVFILTKHFAWGLIMLVKLIFKRLELFYQLCICDCIKCIIVKNI